MSARERDLALVSTAAQAVADFFFGCLGGDPAWPDAPKFNEGDHAVACAVLDAVADDIARAERERVLAEVRAVEWHHLGDETYAAGMESAKEQIIDAILDGGESK